MALTELVARSALADDRDPQVAWRRVQAKVLAQRGDFENAEALARKAIELVERATTSTFMRARSRISRKSFVWPGACRRRWSSSNARPGCEAQARAGFVWGVG
jgi:hypothetical protein